MGDGRQESQEIGLNPHPIRTAVGRIAQNVFNELEHPELMGERFLKQTAKVDIKKIIWLDSQMILASVKDMTPENGEERFDSQRASLKKTAISILNQESYQKYFGKPKLQRIVRETYGNLLIKLIEMSTQATDDRLRGVVRGAAWSMVANDANKTLSQNGSEELSQEWKSGLWKIINVRNPDMKQLKSTITKFSKGDPGVFVTPA